MTVSITGKYLGNKRVELTHGPSGAVILTDAPKDNQGEGRAFSPTDLCAASLGACMMTVMSIVAERDGISLSGMCMGLSKEMAASPRRIGAIPILIHMPQALNPEQREKLERTAKTCPVSHSLSPSVVAEVAFLYDV